MNLIRFIDAQNSPSDGYLTALQEIRTTGKRRHWIWYIFPQLEGLGSSTSARFFALADLEEGREYMHHPVLGVRLLEISNAVVERLRHGADLLVVMNSRVDVQKLVSCMTLFRGLAARTVDKRQLAEAAGAILEAAQGQGFPPCGFTEDQLMKTQRPAG